MSGFLGRHHTKETKDKLRKIFKDKPLSDKTKRKLSIILTGRKKSEEHKKKIGEAHEGQPCSEKTKIKIGVANKGKKRSEEFCKRKSELWKGDKSPTWKGGITSENRKVRASIEYRLWRKAVFTRDTFTCQKCIQRGGVLRPHHIFNFADFPELRLAIDNGITFCEKDHNKFHTKYGRKNNTKEQLEEFLQ